jgi:hypothetical protein
LVTLLLAVEMWATRHAWVSWPERLALLGVAACTLSAGALALGPLKLPAWLSLPSLPLLLYLPARWYPLLHTLLALLALSAPAAAWRPMRRRWAAVALLALAAAGLLRISSNLRFVAWEQAPLSGALLDGVTRLLPTPSTVTRAQRPPDSGGELLPQLGDADIVLVTVDALRADRAFSLPGVRWKRVYAQAPSTALSIRTLMTGAAPDQPAGPTLAETLRSRGWLTQAFYPAGLFWDGRRRLEPLARTRFGFAWTDTRTLPAEELTDAVLKRLSELHDEPRLFLWVHYFDAHEPYRGVGYDAAVAVVEREVRRLAHELKGLRRPVIFCLTADHGEELGDHGGAYHNSSVYEEQVRVPLTLAAPGLSDADLPGPLELTDVAPVLLSLAGVDPPRPLPRPHDAHSQVDSRRMLVRGSWKLIHDLRRDYDELYDLEGDPGERKNLFDQRRDIAAPLHVALDAWFNLSSPAELAEILARGRTPAERAAAARELGQMEAGGEVLTAALRDADAEVHAEAALALGALGNAAAVPSLLELLERPEYRHRAGIQLGRLRDRRAVPALIETLRDVELERHAAHYLGWLGGDESVAPLMAAAGDLRVRSDAYLALGRIATRTQTASILAFLRARLPGEPYEDARANLTRALRLAAP